MDMLVSLIAVTIPPYRGIANYYDVQGKIFVNYSLIKLKKFTKH